MTNPIPRADAKAAAKNDPIAHDAIPAQPAPDVPRPCHCGGTVHVDHFKNPKAVVIVCEQCGTEWLGYWSDSERSIIERWNSQPAHTEWNAAIEAAADLADTTFSGSGTDAARIIRMSILALRKGGE